MANTIKKTVIHPESDDTVDLYPKTSVDQVDGLEAELNRIEQDYSDLVVEVSDKVAKSNINSIVYGTATYDNMQALVSYSYEAVKDTLVYRGDSGRINVGYPINEMNAVNMIYLNEVISENLTSSKEWADNKFVPKKRTSNLIGLYRVNSTNDEETKDRIIEATSNWKNNTVVARDGAGHFSTGTNATGNQCVSYTQMITKYSYTIRYLALNLNIYITSHSYFDDITTAVLSRYIRTGNNILIFEEGLYNGIIYEFRLLGDGSLYLRLVYNGSYHEFTIPSDASLVVNKYELLD